MRYLLFIIIILSISLACEQEDMGYTNFNKPSCQVEKWESLGGQTLIEIDAVNPSQAAHEMNMHIEVINSEGDVFSKDTTIEFRSKERAKHLQLIVETGGEIKEVLVKTY